MNRSIYAVISLSIALSLSQPDSALAVQAKAKADGKKTLDLSGVKTSGGKDFQASADHDPNRKGKHSAKVDANSAKLSGDGPGGSDVQSWPSGPAPLVPPENAMLKNGGAARFDARKSPNASARSDGGGFATASTTAGGGHFTAAVTDSPGQSAAAASGDPTDTVPGRSGPAGGKCSVTLTTAPPAMPGTIVPLGSKLILNTGDGEVFEELSDPPVTLEAFLMKLDAKLMTGTTSGGAMLNVDGTITLMGLCPLAVIWSAWSGAFPMGVQGRSP